RKINDRVGEGVALSNIGFVYDRQKQPQQALKLYQEALVIHRAMGDRPSESVTLNNLGRLQLASGNYPAATETFFKAIEVLESLRPGLNDASKVSIFETQSRTYGLLQKSLVAQNKHEAALEIAERGRARAFVERLAQRITDRAPGQQRVPDALSRPIQIDEIKRVARDQKATLVQYSIIEDQQLFIWIVKPTGEVSFRNVSLQGVGKSPLSLEELVATGREAIGVRGFSFNESTVIAAQPALSAAAQNQKLQQMHQLLIQPIADLLPSDPTARVIFIPQRSLFMVPFAALQDSKGKYLIEQHTILTAPSVQVLALTHQQRQQRGATQLSLKGNDVLLVGNPTMPSIRPNLVDQARVLSSLPGAEQEVKSIAELLGAEALIGNQATKATVVSRMIKARLIHLATHGLLEDFKRVGVPGAIALAPSDRDDGMLNASEILDLPLIADLVVLSACDTGRGRITGDGVIGLSRSLLTAGVPSVIVSLWKVPDAPTATLMTEFYKNLLQKPDKAQALRQAMLTTLQQYPDPKSWAAFTLIGEAE
ncbi:MAG: CHAT domain-containing tetratricopeptide repeat protein, partial [Leptolyngbyaceae cyanobacterium bins.59]|nr:CHAT domain-containing tetratricopeptide repeat protein [Leptolyngbyaceae cyanobacterium bins.59]